MAASKKKALNQTFASEYVPGIQASGLESRSDKPNEHHDSQLSILGNKRSHIYHRADCPNYSGISPKNQLVFDSEGEAQKAGFRLAGNCP